MSEINFSLLARMTSRFVYSSVFLSYRLLNVHAIQARLASTTAWVASPIETVALLDELEEHERSTPTANGA